jgi:hypothetical protein
VNRQFPLVTRSHHEEVVAELRRQLAERERELHRLHDLIFKQQFGVQLHDSLPSAPETAVPPDAPVDDAESQQQADQRRLASIRRTNPSQLGPALEQVMARNAHRMARSAHPVRTVNAAKSNAVFEKARAEA